MTLSDSTIFQMMQAGAQLINPFYLDKLQPASYDLTLDNKFMRLRDNPGGDEIIPGQEVEYVSFETDAIRMIPGGFFLGCTQEMVTLPDNMIARVEGKSSLGRIGLMVHVTAGFIDPGFKGNITLEIKNVGTWPIRVGAGMSIAQLAFQMLDKNAERPYGSSGLGSRYQDSRGVIGARV